MKEVSYLIISKNGIKGVRKSKPSLRADEIAVKVNLDIPNALFEKPLLEATITIDKSVAPEKISPEIIINTKDLIEQQTGAKIDFKIISMIEKVEANEEVKESEN